MLVFYFSVSEEFDSVEEVSHVYYFFVAAGLEFVKIDAITILLLNAFDIGIEFLKYGIVILVSSILGLLHQLVVLRSLFQYSD